MMMMRWAILQIIGTTCKGYGGAILAVALHKQMIGKEEVYELCELLEFWPDHDYRMKFRGRVLVRPMSKMMETYAGKLGIPYDETWMELRETELHSEDRENLYIHCARKLDGRALIIHRARPELEEAEG
jgi:hypothetical protein